MSTQLLEQSIAAPNLISIFLFIRQMN